MANHNPSIALIRKIVFIFLGGSVIVNACSAAVPAREGVQGGF